ncbi:hypothetical protein [Actinobacillus pleuropneumoniae]|uniref:hypothetical protein n=1 Tax=Actinobacillus pleuropneumoniae TaxID=715 RepID=UPI001F3A1E22|nr:hypothetical protein [Actinobacillus pleuropneumoniae]UKH17982.1 hypothetical protein D1110_02280 [Actinobacillus pleuropneumoniae]
MTKELPRFGEICYFTIKLKDMNLTHEWLGYLSYKAIDREFAEDEEYFYDEDGVCFKRFVYIPEIDHSFGVNDIVSWRPLHSWNNNESTRPEDDGTYLVVLDDGQVTTLDYESLEGQWDCYSDETILYWMEFPEPPEEIKNGKRK